MKLNTKLVENILGAAGAFVGGAVAQIVSCLLVQALITPSKNNNYYGNKSPDD